jgi:hypothetical protein
MAKGVDRGLAGPYTFGSRRVVRRRSSQGEPDVLYYLAADHGGSPEGANRWGTTSLVLDEAGDVLLTRHAAVVTILSSSSSS